MALISTRPLQSATRSETWRILEIHIPGSVFAFVSTRKHMSDVQCVVLIGPKDSGITQARTRNNGQNQQTGITEMAAEAERPMGEILHVVDMEEIPRAKGMEPHGSRPKSRRERRKTLSSHPFNLCILHHGHLRKPRLEHRPRPCQAIHSIFRLRQ